MRLFNPGARGFIFLRKFRAFHQRLQKLHRRLNFAALPFGDNGAEQRPHIFGGRKMVAAVAHDVNGLHQLPALQLLDTGADIGAGDAEGFDDFVGVHRPPQEVEQRVDLRHGAVHAPFGAHFAPVEDEFFGSRVQFHDGEFSMVRFFCQYRNT